LIALLGLLIVPEAFAERRGGDGGMNHPDRDMHPGAEATPRGYEHETEQGRQNVEQNRDERANTDGSPANDRAERDDPAAMRRAVAVPGGAVAPRENQAERRNGCSYQRGHRGVSGCDYYYDNESDDYYDAEGEPMPENWSPDQQWPAGASAAPQPKSSGAPSQGAAKLAPAPGPEDYTESFTPEGNDGIRDKLMAGRKLWMQKKAVLEDANAAVARAEYQQDQTGKAVDPRLIANQKQAHQEAEAAYHALAPLVQQARDAGVSPRVLELYNEMNQAD
jgi:hypothetical protein